MESQQCVQLKLLLFLPLCESLMVQSIMVELLVLTIESLTVCESLTFELFTVELLMVVFESLMVRFELLAVVHQMVIRVCLSGPL